MIPVIKITVQTAVQQQKNHPAQKKKISYFKNMPIFAADK
jgi:hypothetical protein